MKFDQINSQNNLSSELKSSDFSNYSNFAHLIKDVFLKLCNISFLKEHFPEYIHIVK